MILIIDLTHPTVQILSDQFVLPVLRIVQKSDHSLERARIETLQSIPSSCTGIIICGTALADTWYQTHSLSPILAAWNGPLLGICAGMQMLLSHTGGEIVSRTEIGMIPITLTARGRKDTLTQGKDNFSGYALHQYTVIQTRIWHVLARSEKAAHIVRHDTYPWYGVLFHPEVRNEWIIERFVTEIQL